MPPLTLANAPDVLTVQETQQILKIGRDATYALINSGTLSCFRAGRSIRVPRVAVERLLGVR